MKKRLLMVLLAGFAFTACTNTVSPTPKVSYQKPTKQKMKSFTPVMTKVALSTREDAKYKRMALKTSEEKEWFKTLMYRLWDRQITRGQFITEGITKYPTHQYEFNFIAQGFQKHS